MRVSGFSRGWQAATATVVLAAAIMGHIGPAQAAIPAASCSDLNGSVKHFNNGDPAFQFTTSGSSFVAGQTISVTASVGIATVSLTGAVAVTFTGSTSFAVPSTGPFVESIASSTVDTDLTFTCTGGSASNIQPMLNAQVGVFNGQQTLRSFNDWLSKTIVASFNQGRRPTQGAAERLGTLSAYANLKRLRGEERELTEELADIRAGAGTADGTAVDLERRLASVRQQLIYARTAAQLSSDPEGRGGRIEQASASSGYTLVPEMSVGGAQPSAKAPDISLGTRDLAEMCAPGDGTGGTFDQKWNVWLEGRVVGASDSVLQNNVFGFNGSGGTDYKLQPWLALGLAVGVETYETKFGTSGTRAGTVGLSLMPYVGVRLSDNVTASAFTGFTHINYNTSPGAGITAQFEALRLMMGGAVTGVWREENWRFQPSLSGTFGSETQNAYVDSQANAIGAQTLYYGRVSAGPEIGYTSPIQVGSGRSSPSSRRASMSTSRPSPRRW
jgi:hypothetical protein